MKEQNDEDIGKYLGIFEGPNQSPYIEFRIIEDKEGKDYLELYIDTPNKDKVKFQFRTGSQLTTFLHVMHVMLDKLTWIDQVGVQLFPDPKYLNKLDKKKPDTYGQ